MVKKEDQIHIYLRDTKGRIITHFLFPLKDWETIELYAKSLNIPPNEAFIKLLMDYIDKAHSING